MPDSPPDIPASEKPESTWASEFRKLRRVATAFCLDWVCFRVPGKFIKDEWRELKRGKALLIVIAVTCLGLGFWVRGKVLPTVISTPAPASVQIPHAIQDEREWPSLTDEQVAAWTKALKPFKIAGIRVLWGQEVQATKLFHSLQEIGKRLQCRVISWGGSADTPEITILTGKESPYGNVFVQLLKDYAKAVNCPVKLEQTDGEVTDGTDVAIYLPDSPPWPQRTAFAQQDTQPDSARNAPWVSVELEFNPSVISGDEISGVTFRLTGHNTGPIPALGVLNKLEIAGKPQSIDGGVLAAGEERSVYPSGYTEMSAIGDYKEFAAQKWPIRCNVIYSDLSGGKFEIASFLCLSGPWYYWEPSRFLFGLR